MKKSKLKKSKLKTFNRTAVSLKFKDRKNLWLPYNQMKVAGDPIEVASTEGVRLKLADGQELVDGISSWWTACHGYNHPHIIDAIVRQVKSVPHVMLGGIVHQPAVRLAKRLAQLTLGEDAMCFFSESGSVAVEVALKIAVQYWINQGATERKRFACFQGAYHGDTTGAMSVCDAEDSMHSHFKGYLIEQFQAAVPETETQRAFFSAWLEQHHRELAGVIIEPLVQMAAGMRMHSAKAISFIAQECEKWELLLIADEIAVGFGRTGSMFAVEQSGVKPDILCVGKALTGGTLPLAATIASPKVYEQFHSSKSAHALMHGPTYMGNPTACAAANASLDLFEQGSDAQCLRQVKQIEKILTNALQPLQKKDRVADVRIKGAVGAVQLDSMIDVDAAMAFFRYKGAFVRPLRDVVYLAPSFVIEEQDLRMLCAAVADFVSKQ